MENNPKPSQEELQKLMQDFDSAAWELAKSKLHKHTIQILNEDDTPQEYKPGGSGVLVSFSGMYFMFTAAHVTELPKDINLYVNSRVGVVEVIGDYNESDLSENSKIDVAFIQLIDQLGRLLSETYEFLPLENLLFGHAPKKEEWYMACGYPEVNIRLDEKTHTVITGSSHFLLQMITNEKAYQFHKFDPNTTYLLRFGGKGTDLETGEETKDIEYPIGISGGGLWVLFPRWINGRLEIVYFLIGIMFAYRQTKFQALVANRIEIIIEEIKNRYRLNIGPARGY